MKNIITKFQKIMMAVAFAEADEWKMAREMTPDAKISREPSWLNKIFMAITFAESGLHDEAIGFLKPAAAKNRGFNSEIMENLGLKGVRLMYGTISI